MVCIDGKFCQSKNRMFIRWPGKASGKGTGTDEPDQLEEGRTVLLGMR